MKIVRLTTLLDFGGQERKYISFTDDGPNALRHDYVFAAIGHGGHAEKAIRDKGFDVHIFQRNPAVRNLWNIVVLWRWFRHIRPDVVHTAAAEANFHGIIAARLAGVPTIIAEEIGFPRHSKWARRVFAWLYRRVYKVVCVSESVKAFLKSIGEIQPEKGVVLYNPVVSPGLRPRVPSEVFTLVCVGRLEPVKNQALLIRALGKMQHTQVRLCLVGDGSDRAALEQLVQTLGLSERVTFTGFTADPTQYLRRGDVFVLPSLSEGFGIAVVEAMLQELPCLCSNVGGIPEFIHEGENGWLFDPHDEAALVARLDVLAATSGDALRRIGQNARVSVENRFTTTHYRLSLENLYEKRL